MQFSEYRIKEKSLVVGQVVLGLIIVWSLLYNILIKKQQLFVAFFGIIDTLTEDLFMRAGFGMFAAVALTTGFVLASGPNDSKYNRILSYTVIPSAFSLNLLAFASTNALSQVSRNKESINHLKLTFTAGTFLLQQSITPGAIYSGETNFILDRKSFLEI